jgi:hypothetical protein
VKLRSRAMQPDDIAACVDIVARHPVWGPRYGKDIELLPEAYRRLLLCEAQKSSVIFDDKVSPAIICYFGVSAFVRDEFVLAIKTPPLGWTGPELARRMIAERSPVLSGEELREANSRGGMNLVCWGGITRPGYETNQEMHRFMMTEFIHLHQGYYWKEAISNQPESVDRLAFVLMTGGWLWDSVAGCYTTAAGKDLEEIVLHPHIIGTTRELERSRTGGCAGSWVGALFDYHAPILGFSRSEQRLLSDAVSGATDEQLATTMRISLPTIKKMWVSIYNRVEDRLPALIADPHARATETIASFSQGRIVDRAGLGSLRSDPSASSRGREKRRGLLAYLREHPEELRPVSRSLLRNS